MATEAEARKPKKVPEPEPAPAADAALVDVPCTFAPGDVVRYRVVKSGQKSGPSRPSTSQSYRYDVEFTVVSSESGSTQFDMRYADHAVLSASNPMAAQMLADLQEAVGQEVFRLRFDHATKEQTVVNPEALTRVGDATAEALGAQLRALPATAPPEVVEKNIAMAQSMARNTVLIEQGLKEESGPLLAFACAAYAAGATPYDTQFANPLGGPPFHAVGTLVVTPTKAGGFTFVDSSAVDPVAAMDVLRPLLEGQSIPVPAEVDAMFLDLRTEATVELDGVGPWPTGFTGHKVTTLQGFKDEQTITATRVAP